ncbi:MAG TPA: carboxypeptidase-like regulatory domain-containing protein [Candidatus Acidoferrum sp.]|nr:carboxypeptidase-like regulatory domain-containing protein [Candidatus Acidoferrum sp.]
MTRNATFSISNIDFLRRNPIVAVSVLAAMLFVFALLGQPPALAQTTSATLTGTVFDASGAVVPDATVTLKNEASGDTRSTKSNGEGYFTFASVPPATYSVTVEKENFKTWTAKSIALTSDDKRNLTGIKLEPGLAKETVVVESSSVQITPTDSGEKSTLINEHILQNVAIVGQNAAEFVKIMPGMAFAGGAVNTVYGEQSQDERTGTGPVGNGFSANGTRQAALDITSDGAHIIDPGCNCGQAMNTNADMTAELKVMTSNFGADEAKGPVTINVVGKSGGQQFHGEAYVYARSWHLNANDPQDKNSNIARPETKYFYPGGQIGGPVLIPGTNFNHNRDKLFFFYGMEYYKQNVDNGVYHAVVPTGSAPAPGTTMNMRAGDFSDHNYLSHLNGYAVTGTPGGSMFTNGKLNTAADPNGQILMNLYPLPNQDPTRVGSGGWNYANGETRYSNMLQERAKVDYNLNQSTKLYVSYNHQHDNALNSLDVLWSSGGNSWAAPTTPYPSSLAEKSTSDVVTANLTKIFSPTLTNEVVFSYTYLNLPNSFSDRSKVDRGALGINYQFLFNHGDPNKLIFPQMTGWGDGISNMLNTGFELNGTVYAKKTLPSVADNLVKVWKTHTTKFGFYWERTWNEQPGNGSVNGSMVFSNWGGGSSGNAYADMLIGQMTQYSELNYDVLPAFRYMTADFYATDSWKISRRLTLDYGMRFSHLGPWVDTTGYGFSAWYPSLYAQDKGAAVPGGSGIFPGIEWNKANSSTALSGSGSRLLFYNPRVGFAWDVFGTGRTVLRGGYGMYHFHDEQNVQNGAYGVVRGSFSSPTLNGVSISSLAPLTGSLNIPNGLTALDPKDDQEPRTQSYSFTVAERMPWKSLLEVAYVGSKSDYLSNYNNNFDQINDITVGKLFGLATNSYGDNYGWLPDCNSSMAPKDALGNTNHDSQGRVSCALGGADTGYTSNAVSHARPLWAGPCTIGTGTAANPKPDCLGTLKIIDHKMYSNYNALQVTWNKQAGHMTFLTNYTFGKALGIRGENGAAAGDPTVLRSNYGTLPNNRAQIFNFAYVFEFPTLHNGNRFVKGAANGWQISGITQYQTGADLQAAVSSNFGYTGFIPAGTTFMGQTLTYTDPITGQPVNYSLQANSTNALGAPDLTLMPTLTCDPRSGLKANQYINGNCFSPWVTPGKQGNYVWPVLTGPGFFNTDMSLFKNFTWGNSESKKLQFRFSGYNFINHPNRTFLNSDQNLNLTFNSSGALTNSNYGFATNTIGHRIVQGEIKLMF